MGQDLAALRAQVLDRARADLGYYCEHFLRIKDKRGEIVPLLLNDAQRIVHDKIEDQLKRKGRVRVIIVKGRQQGISTYCQARIRWLMKHRPGLKAYTIAHEQASTDNLFAIAKLMHEMEPAWARPQLGAANAKELYLSHLRSKLEIATAGTRHTGRSGTAQILHASEAAYWEDPDANWAAIGQVVPTGEGVDQGTEIYVESTGNGPNDFARRVMLALGGQSDYEVVFVPWYLQREYRITPPAGFTLREDKGEGENESEAEIAEAYGLTDEQMAWRRLKIDTDFKGDANRFAREYPANLQEAFSNPSKQSFIPASLVIRAQKAQIPATGRILIGCDPAVSDDGDTCGIVIRQGRRVHLGKRYQGKTGPQIAAMLIKLAERYKDNGVRIFLDVGGLGIVIYQIIQEAGYSDYVQPVNFSWAATEDTRYANLRAELYGELREYLRLGAQLPADPVWVAELTATGSTEDAQGRLLMQPKKQVRKEYGQSPDLADALALTFALPVQPKRKPSRVNDGSMTLADYLEV